MRTFRWVVAAVVCCLFPILLGSGGCGDGGLIQLSDADEVAIGRQAAADIEREQRVLADTPEARRVEHIGQTLVKGATRTGMAWSFKVLDVKEPNAFALPGGPLYVTKGLLDMEVSDGELAGVIGHEIAHVNQRHNAKAIERGLTLALASQIALRRASETTQLAVQLALQYGIQLPHSRRDEYEADAVGVRLAYNAGYAAGGLSAFLTRLNALPTATRAPEWMSDHPETKARIARTTKLADLVTGQPRPIPLTLTADEQKALKGLTTEEKVEKAKP